MSPADPSKAVFNSPADAAAATQAPGPSGKPLTPEQLQAQHEANGNALEAMREEKLRQIADGEDDATIMGGGLPGAAQIPGANGAMMGADQLAQKAQDTFAASIEGNKHVRDEKMAAARMQRDLDTQMGPENNRVEKVLGDRIQAGYDHLGQVQKDVEAQTKQSLLDYEAVQKKMTAIATAEPKGLFGQAGVNSLMGRIAIMLGGVGTNGNGPNANLEYIKGLADRNIASQQRQFEMLGKTAEGQHTIYGMLQTKLQNATATEATMHNMALEVYKSQMRQVANSHAGQKAKIAYQTEAANVDAEINKNNQIAANALISQQGAALEIAAKNQAAGVAGQANYLKQAELHQNQSVDGFVGWVPKASHDRVSKMVGGARTMVMMADEIQRLIASGASVDTIRNYMVNSAVNFKAARDFLETGTRIEAGEQRIIDQLDPSTFEVIGNMLAKKDYSGIQTKLESIKATVSHAAYRGVHAVAPRTTAYDSQDPLWGQYNPRTYTPPAVSAMEGWNGTPAGQSVLKTMPTMSPGY
jgi:hypothetical protein